MPLEPSTTVPLSYGLKAMWRRLLTNEAPPGLDLPEGLESEAFDLWLHRVGWTLFAVLILAALLGLLGSGPVSSRTERAGNNLTVGYDRFTRYHSPAELSIRLSRANLRNGSFRVRLGRRFIEAIQIEAVQPQPEWVEIDPHGHVFSFKAPRIEKGDALIVFHYQPAQPFADVPIEITAPSGERARFSQFVYP